MTPRSPRFPRTISDTQFYIITGILALIAAAPVAVLSMFIYSPIGD